MMYSRDEYYLPAENVGEAHLRGTWFKTLEEMMILSRSYYDSQKETICLKH